MDAELIAVGTELLSGARDDSNSVGLARRLVGLGLTMRSRTVLPDDVELVADGIRAATRRADLVVITGGLGPTRDDVTREALSLAADLPLQTEPSVVAAIRKRYEDRGVPVPEGAERQARLPEGAQLLANRLGTAPGLVLTIGRARVAALPGVPRELEPMFDKQLVPRLRKMLPSRTLAARAFKIARLTESEVDERIGDVCWPEGAGITLLAGPGVVEIQVRVAAGTESEAETLLDEAQQEILERFGDDLFGRGEDTLASVVGDLLQQGGHSLACAESCSGGMLSRQVTDVPGSSEYFLGGVVAYSDRLKQSLLDVPAEALESCGAVSREVAAAMATGARSRTGATHALSITGLAGPGGGSEDKPVGLVYIGVAGGGSTAVRRHVLAGDRKTVRRRSALTALDLLRRRLLGLDLPGDEA